MPKKETSRSHGLSSQHDSSLDDNVASTAAEGSEKTARACKPWLRNAASSALVQMVRERCLSSTHASFAAQIIIKPDLNLVREFLSGLRPLTTNLGKTEQAFQQFVLLICTHRLINTPHTLSVALNMDDRAELLLSLQRTVVPSAIEHIGLTPMERPRNYSRDLEENPQDSVWELGLRSIAVCDILLRLPQDRKSELLPALWQAAMLPHESMNYRIAAEIHLLNLLEEISEINVESSADRNDSEFYFVNSEDYISKIGRRITKFYSVRKNDEVAHRLLQNIIKSRIIISINELLLDGLILHYKETEKRADFIEGMLKNSLHPLFDAAHFPEERRAEFVAQIMSELFEYEAQPEGPWSAGIRVERQALLSAPSAALPEKAPAIWKADKMADDSPPDFIKRHYGAWLREDGTGLTRPDVKRLDRSLYIAIANWLQKDGNSFPPDCPLPTKSEVIDRELERSQGKAANMSARTFFTKKARDRAAWKREDQNER